MGVLSSWNLLALAHHVIVMISSSNDHNFATYELIGDDLVLTNRETYIRYLSIMRDLGVEVAPMKTYVSEGSHITLEFAKKYCIMGIPVTPIPVRSFVTIFRDGHRGLTGLFRYIVENQSAISFGSISHFLLSIGDERLNSVDIQNALVSTYIKAILPKACRGYELSSTEVRFHFKEIWNTKSLGNPILDNGSKDLFVKAYSHAYTYEEMEMIHLPEIIFKQLQKHISAESFEELRALAEKREIASKAVKDIFESKGIILGSEDINILNF